MSPQHLHGRVAAVNAIRSTIAIEVDGYGYTLAEVLEDIAVEGDELVSGFLRSLGNQTLRIDVADRELRVFIEDYDAKPQAANRFLSDGS